jgi:hypothetical protein
MLGSFFILYFRSSTLALAWPFLLILFGAIVSNELFQKRYKRLVFQISYFYLSVFSFCIFLLPLLIHRFGPWVFILSGAVSLTILSAYLFILNHVTGEKFRESKKWLIISVLSIFSLVNILYFSNLIPPIPLSLRDAGIYHSLSRDSLGGYIVEGEEKGFLQFFHLREKVHWVPGQPLFAYSAIFSPAAIDTNIVHEWQYKDEATGNWITSTRIPLTLPGGREKGYRTYSTKSNLTPGSWRVNVATPRGLLIGRISFRIIPVQTSPFLETLMK